MLQIIIVIDWLIQVLSEIVLVVVTVWLLYKVVKLKIIKKGEGHNI